MELQMVNALECLMVSRSVHQWVSMWVSWKVPVLVVTLDYSMERTLVSMWEEMKAQSKESR